MKLLATLTSVFCFAVSTALTSGGALAQSNSTIKLIVPYPAGGNADNIARIYAEALSKRLGQPVVIDNKPGAGAVIGAQAAARAPADGTTFLVAPTAVFVVTPHLKSTPYKAKDDFVPIARLANWIPVMVVRKDFPGSTLDEVVSESKKRAGKVTYASAGPATMTHLMGELLNLQFGTKNVHVPYKGSAEFISDLLSGRVDMVYDSVVVPQVKAGQLKAIASMAAERHPELPSTPTLKELGVDLDIPNWYGIFAPKGTSLEVVDRIGAATKDVMESMDQGKLTKMSMTAAFQGPAEFRAQIEKDDAIMKNVIKRANVRIE